MKSQQILQLVNLDHSLSLLSRRQINDISIIFPRRQALTFKYRPICFMDTLYTIAWASKANRLKTALDKRYNEDQSGFISGQYTTSR